MKGRVLGFSALTGEGAIAGSDGTRYTFHQTEWKERDVQPNRGMAVDFMVQDSTAHDIYPALDDERLQSHGTESTRNQSTIGNKNRVTAGVLALLLGGFGVHKYYLGYHGAGTGLLVATVVGLLTSTSRGSRSVHSRGDRLFEKNGRRVPRHLCGLIGSRGSDPVFLNTSPSDTVDRILGRWWAAARYTHGQSLLPSSPTPESNQTHLKAAWPLPH